MKREHERVVKLIIHCEWFQLHVVIKVVSTDYTRRRLHGNTAGRRSARNQCSGFEDYMVDIAPARSRTVRKALATCPGAASARQQGIVCQTV